MSEMPSSKLPALCGEEEALVDRISSLPDSIQCHILSFLRTHEAVQTSLLSRDWHSLWTKVPSFSFYHHDQSSKSYQLYEKLVNMALLLNNSKPINSFELDFETDSFYLRTWTSTAIDRNVRKLHVRAYERLFQVPYKLFTCKSLEHLELAGICVSLNVPSFVFLPKLTELKLCDIEYETEESIPKLLSGCPMLKHLSISIYGEDNINRYRICSPALKYFFLKLNLDYANPNSIDGRKFEIDAPSLEELCIHAFSYGDIAIWMENLTSLNKADIYLSFVGDLTPISTSCDSVLRAIEGLSSVKFLRLRGDTTMHLSKATSKLSANFQRLTKLDLLITCCKWSALLDFMRCSDCLQVINLEKEEPCNSQTHVVSWRNPNEVPNCLALSLKDIAFKGVQGLKDELAMIKYVLKHGSVLERLQVQTGMDVRSRRTSKILKKISAFSRKSQRCKIVFP